MVLQHFDALRLFRPAGIGRVLQVARQPHAARHDDAVMRAVQAWPSRRRDQKIVQAFHLNCPLPVGREREKQPVVFLFANNPLANPDPSHSKKAANDFPSPIGWERAAVREELTSIFKIIHLRRVRRRAASSLSVRRATFAACSKSSDSTALASFSAMTRDGRRGRATGGATLPGTCRCAACPCASS